MTFIEIKELPAWERLPGWHGRLFHSENMTFGHWDFAAGSSIHDHHHPNEEVWYVIDGTLDLTVDGVTHRAGPGSAAIIPPDTPHEVLAITDGRALVVNHPVRSDEPSS